MADGSLDEHPQPSIPRFTEAEWLASHEWHQLINSVSMNGGFNERQVRLFTAACCRLIWHLLVDERSRRAVEVSERYVDGAASPEELSAAVRDASEASEALYAIYVELDETDEARRIRIASGGLNPPLEIRIPQTLACASWRASVAACDAAEASDEFVIDDGGEPEVVPDVYEVPEGVKSAAVDYANPGYDRYDGLAEDMAISDVLRDVINPFRTGPINPSWRTADAVAIAQAIYDDRAFERMPILADALEEAGCDDARILDHCRAPRMHVRGCWVVDAVLGRV